MKGKIVLKALWCWVKDNSTKLLAGGAIVAEMFGFYFMHREAPIVRDRLNDLGEDAGWIDKLKVAGPVYLPAIGMFILSSGCIVGGCAVGEAKAAMMAGLYSASETALRKYEEKMVDAVGKDKAQEMHDNVIDELEKERNHPIDDSKIEYTTHGGHLFYDTLTARFFTSSESFVRKTVQVINDRIYGVDMQVGVNEWYNELGISSAKLAEPFCWDVDHKLEVSFAAARTDDGRLYDIIVYFEKPRLYNGDLPRNYSD